MATSTAKARRTRVLRQPFWVPKDDDGRGAWRWLPTDLAHTAEVIEFDEVTGDRIRSRNVYAAKGWISVYEMQDRDPKDERLKLLPDNWKAYARGDDRKPVFSDATVALLEKRRKAAA